MKYYFSKARQDSAYTNQITPSSQEKNHKLVCLKGLEKLPLIFGDKASDYNMLLTPVKW